MAPIWRRSAKNSSRRQAQSSFRSDPVQLDALLRELETLGEVPAELARRPVAVFAVEEVGDLDHPFGIVRPQAADGKRGFFVARASPLALRGKTEIHDSP